MEVTTQLPPSAHPVIPIVAAVIVVVLVILCIIIIAIIAIICFTTKRIKSNYSEEVEMKKVPQSQVLN